MKTVRILGHVYYGAHYGDVVDIEDDELATTIVNSGNGEYISRGKPKRGGSTTVDE